MAEQTEEIKERAALDKEKIKKLAAGELAGNIATAICGADVIYFIICFSVSLAYGYETLKLITLITSPAILIVFVAIAAFFNFKFGNAIDRLINEYVLNVLVENAALMHPERDTLSYSIALNHTTAEIKVNGYKEKIIFDFSAFNRLSLIRKVTILSSIENRLIATFCRLVMNGGAKYSNVNYTEISGDKITKKPVAIIENGELNKKAVKSYYKNK